MFKKPYEIQLHAKVKTLIFSRWTRKILMQQDSVLQGPLKLRTGGTVSELLVFVCTKYAKYMSNENILVNLKFGQEFFMQREN